MGGHWDNSCGGQHACLPFLVSVQVLTPCCGTAILGNLPHFFLPTTTINQHRTAHFDSKMTPPLQRRCPYRNIFQDIKNWNSMPHSLSAGVGGCWITQGSIWMVAGKWLSFLAYVLMRSHIHVLPTPPTQEIPQDRSSLEIQPLSALRQRWDFADSDHMVQCQCLDLRSQWARYQIGI